MLNELAYSAFLDELEKIAASSQRMTVSKTREGRRPLSVATMLRKDQEGTLHKKAGLLDALKTPIPGTKDWFVRTGKTGLSGALKTTAGKPVSRAATVTRGGVTSIGSDELKRMGFGDLSKMGGASSSEAYKSIAALKSQLEPGDILLTRAVKPTLMSRVVSAVQGTEYGHSSIYAGNGKVIDTRVKDGVIETTLPEVHKEWGGGRDVRAYRPRVSAEERKKAVEIARTFVGKAYDKAGALRMLLPAAKNDGKGPTAGKEKLLCSQLVVQAYPKLNFAQHKHRDHVLPVDISKSPLTKRVGDLNLEKQSFKLQGHTTFQGLNIAIENRKGSVREGVDSDGKPWKTTFKHPYGYIKKTEGKDGEEIDVYVGPSPDAPDAFVVHQRKLKDGTHDEDKVMLGWKSEDDAREAYLDHYNKVGPKLLGPISTISVDELKRKLTEKRKHTKLAEIDISNTSLYGDKAEHTLPKRKGDVPDMNQSADNSKVAVQASDKPGDVPSRDGSAVSGGRLRQEIGDTPTVIPIGGAQYSSQSGAMSR